MLRALSPVALVAQRLLRDHMLCNDSVERELSGYPTSPSSTSTTNSESNTSHSCSPFRHIPSIPGFLWRVLLGRLRVLLALGPGCAFSVGGGTPPPHFA